MYRAVSTFLIRRAKLRVGRGARTGAVTLIQRFGSALNLNIHLHMFFVGRVYVVEEDAFPSHILLSADIREIFAYVNQPSKRANHIDYPRETPGRHRHLPSQRHSRESGNP